MKKLCILFLALGALLACDNELDINAPYQKINVLYAVLDPALDTNYVRIQRGYLGNASADQSFNEPDSIYFDTSLIKVYIHQFEPGSNQIEATYRLEYDNSKSLDSGTFTTQGYYLFRTPANLQFQVDKDYEVYLEREGDVASARTGIVGPVDIIRPTSFQQNRIFNGQILFDLDALGTARIEAFQPIIYFNYREYNQITKDSAYKTEEIRLPLRANNTNGDITIVYGSDELNRSLAGRLEKNPDILRFFIDLDIEIWAASEELVTYYELNEPSAGINQNRPDYRQVNNGAGLVTSRTSARRNNVALERSRFFTKLIESNATCGLNFVDVRNNGRDTCYCLDGSIYCLP